MLKLLSGGASIAIAVGVGGACGSVLRWGLGWSARRAGLSPSLAPFVGTTFANVIGCLLIGMVVIYFANRPGGGSTDRETLRNLIQTGFLGGLTTFSSFIAEATSIASQGRTATLSVYLLANLGLGTVAFILGASLATWYGRG